MICNSISPDNPSCGALFRTFSCGHQRRVCDISQSACRRRERAGFRSKLVEGESIGRTAVLVVIGNLDWMIVLWLSETQTVALPRVFPHPEDIVKRVGRRDAYHSCPTVFETRNGKSFDLAGRRTAFGSSSIASIRMRLSTVSLKLG